VIESETQRERNRCVAVCRRRAELWRRTLERMPTAASQEEARGRANEATYLADLLESGVDLADVPVRDGDGDAADA
jgi:hypothetical protein